MIARPLQASQKYSSLLSRHTALRIASLPRHATLQSRYRCHAEPGRPSTIKYYDDKIADAAPAAAASASLRRSPVALRLNARPRSPLHRHERRHT
jgi:hypothetical protein